MVRLQKTSEIWRESGICTKSWIILDCFAIFESVSLDIGFIFVFGLVPHVIDWGGFPFFFDGHERFLWDLVLSLEIVEGNR